MERLTRSRSPASPTCLTAGTRALQFIDPPERRAYGGERGREVSTSTGPREGQCADFNNYIHGGAWRRGAARRTSHFKRRCMHHAGAHHVVLDFINKSTKQTADLTQMVDQVRRAVGVGVEERREVSMATRTADSTLRSAIRPARISAACVATDGLEGATACRRRYSGPGRCCVRGHIRSRAGAAVEAIGVCEVHRCDGA